MTVFKRKNKPDRAVEADHAVEADRAGEEPGRAAEERGRVSLMAQLAVFFLIGVAVTGALAYFTLRYISDLSVREQKADQAAGIAEYVISSVREYPAYQWLVRYWYDHAQTLDVEYDTGEATSRKAVEFLLRNPGFLISKADQETVETLSEEDQKVYAEIVYNWLLLHINEIKNIYNLAYLYCLSADPDYSGGMFLLSASDGHQRRGFEYGDAYKLGAAVRSTDSQRQALSRAALNVKGYLVDSGDYMDQYTYLATVEGRPVIIGMTFPLSGLTEEVRAQTTRSAAHFMLLQVALSLLCLILISVFMLRPLKRVQESVERYKDDKDSEAAVRSLALVRSRNEIGTLARGFSDMAREIDRYMREITAITSEKERISAELRMAADIQAHALPDHFPAFPDRKEFEIYASMDPAKEVGGDFYDFFMIDDDHLAMVTADVSGKGVPAALFMMTAKTILKTRAQTGGTPAEVLREANASLCENNRENMFVTVWLGVLEISTGILTCADAGHEQLLLWQDGAWQFLPKRRGPALAALDPEDILLMGKKFGFFDQTVQLRPGDVIFQYTDGVTEATDRDNTLYGMDRLIHAAGTAPDVEPENLLPHIRSDIDAFVKDAPQFDDITMLAMRYRGPGETGSES